MHRIWTFLHDESAATGIEYAFLASIISVAAFAAMKTIGEKLSTPFNTAAASLN